MASHTVRFSMHLITLFATTVAVLPLASAVAVHTKGSYLESDTYAARAWINQQDYQRNSAPEAWATCNDKNTIVRKEWYAIAIRDRFQHANLHCVGASLRSVSEKSTLLL